jgi:hypothetical protein
MNLRGWLPAPLGLEIKLDSHLPHTRERDAQRRQGWRCIRLSLGVWASIYSHGRWVGSEEVPRASRRRGYSGRPSLYVRVGRALTADESYVPFPCSALFADSWFEP